MGNEMWKFSGMIGCCRLCFTAVCDIVFELGFKHCFILKVKQINICSIFLFICNNLTSMQNAIVFRMLGKIMFSIFPTKFLFTRFLRPEFPDQTQVMISCRINIKLSIWYPAQGGAGGGLYIKYFLILKINSARSFLSRLDLFSILCWTADLNICPNYKVLINFNAGDIVVTWLITLRRPI